MNQDGQIYFGLDMGIPPEDKERFEEALAAQKEHFEQQIKNMEKQEENRGQS